VRTPNPNGADLPEWPKYDRTRRASLHIDANPRIVEVPDGAVLTLLTLSHEYEMTVDLLVGRRYTCTSVYLMEVIMTRLGHIKPEDMNDEQLAYLDRILQRPVHNDIPRDSPLRGPWNAFLRSPKLLYALMPITQYYLSENRVLAYRKNEPAIGGEVNAVFDDRTCGETITWVRRK
jgi:hypothetical protein